MSKRKLKPNSNYKATDKAEKKLSFSQKARGYFYTAAIGVILLVVVAVVIKSSMKPEAKDSQSGVGDTTIPPEESIDLEGNPNDRTLFRGILSGVEDIDLSRWNIDASQPTYSEGYTVYEYEAEPEETNFTKLFENVGTATPGYEPSINAFVDRATKYYNELIEVADTEGKDLKGFETHTESEYCYMQSYDDQSGATVRVLADIYGNQQVEVFCTMSKKDVEAGNCNVDDMLHDASLVSGINISPEDFTTLQALTYAISNNGTHQTLALSGKDNKYGVQLQLSDNGTEDESWSMVVYRVLFEQPEDTENPDDPDAGNAEDANGDTGSLETTAPADGSVTAEPATPEVVEDGSTDTDETDTQ